MDQANPKTEKADPENPACQGQGRINQAGSLPTKAWDLSVWRPGPQYGNHNPMKPNPVEIERFLVVTANTALGEMVRAAGFACVGESDLIEPDGLGIRPLARTCLEAAKAAGRETTLVIHQAEQWALDGIRTLFRSAKVSIDRIEVLDPGRYKADPQGEVVRRVLRLEPVEESLIGPKGIATPLSTLAERYGALQWVWPDWLAKGLLHLISGESGAGKTTVATDIIMRIFDGADFPDGTKPPPDLKGKRALYIDADLRASHQLTALANGYKLGSDPFDVFEIADAEGVPRTVSTWEDDPYLFDHLEAVLKAGSHWCLFVDTASRFTGSVDLTCPSDLTRWVAPLQRIARNLNIPVLILGHSNGNGGAFGRHLVAACQLGWKIGKDGSLECARSYAAPPEALGFAFTASGPLEWFRAGPGEKGKDRTPLEAAIVSRLESLENLPREMCDRENGWSSLKAWATVQNLIKDTPTGKTQFNRAIGNLEAEKAITAFKDTSSSGKAFTRYRLVKNQQGEGGNP